jgi:tetraacyldisaccharide 4'-kinase
MKPPLFWYQDSSIIGALLSPLGFLYSVATAYRLRQNLTHRATVPVICIGNINAGGTGKTPTVIALTQRLIEFGQIPHIVSRGYGGSIGGPVQVDLTTQNVHEMGDEPLLLAAFAPTWVSKDRAQGVKAAEAAGATVILLDDGFQNPSVYKDLNIVVVDAIKGFGNGRVIPAGPLREPTKAGFARADFVLAIGTDEARAALTLDLPLHCVRLNAQLDALNTGMPWGGLSVLAFAGIGHPEKFFATLKDLGADVVRGEALDDHQPFTNTLLTRLETEAKSRGLIMVTTEKDATRLPDSFRSKVTVLPVRLLLLDWRPLDAKLALLGITRQ